MEQRYDVVLFGAQDGQDPNEVARRMAATFSIQATEALEWMSVKSGTVLKKSVDLDEAERFLQALNRIGAKGNYKPTLFTANTLALEPKYKRFTCPKCAHVTEYDEGADPPPLCPECGLVFAKFKMVEQRKQEVEEVRTRLRRMHAVREETEEKTRQENEEEQRKRQIEDQLRKEMGLPRLVNRPWKLWSSAAATLVLGAGLGVAGMFFIQNPSGHLESTGDPGLDGAANPMESVLTALAGGQLTLEDAQGTGASDAFAAELKTQEQLLALSQSVLEQIDPTGSDAPTSQTSPAETASSVTAARAVQLGLAARPPSDDEALQAFLTGKHEDPEWGAFIMANLRANLEAGATTEARRLADRLKDPRDQSVALAHLAAALTRLGRANEANALLGKLIESIGARKDAIERVELLTLMAPIFSESNMRATASHLVNKAAEAAGAIQPSAERADALARVAQAQARIGLDEEARRTILAASEAMQGPLRDDQRARQRQARRGLRRTRSERQCHEDTRQGGDVGGGDRRCGQTRPRAPGDC